MGVKIKVTKNFKKQAKPLLKKYHLSNQFLSWENIKNLYPNQWVILSEYQYKPNFIFFDWGKVVFKTAQEKGIWKTAKNNFELYASFILEWTGEEESDEFFF